MDAFADFFALGFNGDGSTVFVYILIYMLFQEARMDGYELANLFFESSNRFP